jgi:hypothetical protein
VILPLFWRGFFITPEPEVKSQIKVSGMIKRKYTCYKNIS